MLRPLLTLIHLYNLFVACLSPRALLRHTHCQQTKVIQAKILWLVIASGATYSNTSCVLGDHQCELQRRSCVGISGTGAQPVEVFLVRGPFITPLVTSLKQLLTLCVCKQVLLPPPRGPRFETLIQSLTNIALVVTFHSNLDTLEIFQVHADRDFVRLCEYLLQGKKQTF